MEDFDFLVFMSFFSRSYSVYVIEYSDLICVFIGVMVDL